LSKKKTTKIKRKPIKHKTKRIVIKEADVDIKLIPVVNWLNSQGNIFEIVTQFCCQGNRNEKNPYVIFTSYSEGVLNNIIKKTAIFADVKILYHNPNLPRRYKLEFKSAAEMQSFINKVIPEYKE
jgi:hypothetical protein